MFASGSRLCGSLTAGGRAELLTASRLSMALPQQVRHLLLLLLRCYLLPRLPLLVLHFHLCLTALNRLISQHLRMQRHVVWLSLTRPLLRLLILALLFVRTRILMLLLSWQALLTSLLTWLPLQLLLLWHGWQ